MKKFHEVIRGLREDSDLNQTEFGKKLNMSQKKISRLETGETEPTTEEIIKFCNYYNLSADYILGITEKKISLKEKTRKEMN